MRFGTAATPSRSTLPKSTLGETVKAALSPAGRPPPLTSKNGGRRVCRGRLSTDTRVSAFGSRVWKAEPKALRNLCLLSGQILSLAKH